MAGESCDNSDQDSGPRRIETSRHLRMGVGHLMLWALCSAVLLTMMQATREMESRPLRPVRNRQFQDLLYCLFKGGVLTGILTLVWYRFRKTAPLMTQPGHWLLLYQGAFMLFLPARMVYSWMKIKEPSWLVFTFVACVLLMSTVFMVYGILRTRSWSWRLSFGALLTACVSYCAILLSSALELFASVQPWTFNVLVTLYYVGLLSAVVGIVLSVIKDLTRHQFRDWLHWTGVGTYLVEIGASYLPGLFSLVY